MAEKYQPPSGPPPSYRGGQNQERYEASSGPPPNWRPSNQEHYEPPAGPPPGYRGPHISFAPSQSQSNNYEAPPGPPPSKKQQQQQQETYDPPPGPAPNWRPSKEASDFAPPPGPPPPSKSTTTEPPPYQQHDWTIIPDTSLLPPPPILKNDFSPTANAPREAADRAHDWCRQNPLYAARNLTAAENTARGYGAITLVQPREFLGELVAQRTPGYYRGRTSGGCQDSCVTSSLPLYSAGFDSPLRTGQAKTVYFELKVLSLGRPGHRPYGEEVDAGIAVGFVAPPYPTWRLPGWERGSLGVHGDDGRRYVNDTWGGKDFTRAFLPGQTVGVGMTFRAPRERPGQQYGAGGFSGPMVLDVEVFFTRDGKRDGGWDLHEEMDAESEGGVQGLEGWHDLYAAVGVFGQVEFEVRMCPEDWMFRPERM